MKKTYTITEARKKLPTLIRDANSKLGNYVITVNGKPGAVLISATEYDSWKETEEIMKDKGLMRAIRQGERDIEAGREHDLDDVIKELGWLNTKNVRNKADIKGKKRT